MCRQSTCIPPPPCGSRGSERENILISTSFFLIGRQNTFPAPAGTPPFLPESGPGRLRSYALVWCVLHSLKVLFFVFFFFFSCIRFSYRVLDAEKRLPFSTPQRRQAFLIRPPPFLFSLWTSLLALAPRRRPFFLFRSRKSGRG